MVEAQSQMYLRHMSQENLTHTKINPLQWRLKGKCAQDEYAILELGKPNLQDEIQTVPCQMN